PRDVGRASELIAGRARARAATPPLRGGSRRRGRAADRDRFRFSAEDQENAAIRRELDHLAGGFVNDPDVVLRIDTHRMGDEQSIRAAADLANVAAARVELEEARTAVHEQSRVAEGGGGIAGPLVDEDL